MSPSLHSDSSGSVIVAFTGRGPKSISKTKVFPEATRPLDLSNEASTPTGAKLPSPTVMVLVAVPTFPAASVAV